MMKSKVCTKANEFMKKGYTKSEAFTKAWALCKAEAISEKLHVLSLSTDRYSNTQNVKVRDMNMQHANLMNRANSIQSAEEIAADKAKAQKELADYNRREEIKYQLGRLVRKGQTSTDTYAALRAELATIAA